MYENEWQKIKSRLLALAEAGTVHAQLQGSDSLGRGKALGAECLQIFDILEKFLENFSGSLPEPVVEAIRQFVAEDKNILNNPSNRLYPESVVKITVLIGVLEARVSYLLADTQKESYEAALSALCRTCNAPSLWIRTWRVNGKMHSRRVK